MASENVILDFEEIMSGVEEEETAPVIDMDEIMSAANSGPDDESVLSERDLYDKFSTDNPESLFRAMKQNPGRNYSDEQISTFIEYSIEKGFDPYKVLDGMIESAGPIIKDYASSVIDTAKFAVTPKGRFVPTGVSAGPGAPGGYWVQDQESDKQSASVSITEGALRGASELGVLGKSIGFASAIDRYESESTGYSKFGASRRKRKSWSQFSDDEKKNAINKYRELGKLLSDQIKYQEGEASILGDIVGSFVASGATRPNEFVSTGVSAGPGAPGGYWKQSPGYTEEDVAASDEIQTQILSMINPATANLASYHFGGEGLGASIAKSAMKKTGTKAARNVASGTAEAVGSGGKQLDKALESAETISQKLPKLPFVGDPEKSLSSFKNAVNRTADMLSGLSRAIQRNSDENVFLSMARDTFVDPKNRKLAEKLGHGVFTDYPWLSPALRLMASPTKTMLAGAARATGGAISGGALSALTMDEEMIAQNIIGSGMIAFGGGAYDQAVWGNKNKVAAAANNWLLKQTPEIQEKVKSKFSEPEIARWAVFERWAQQMVLASTGEADVNFVYTDNQSFDTLFEYLKSEGLADNINLDNVTEYAEKIASNSASDKIPSMTRGVQFLNTRNGGSRPIALVNVDAMTSTTIIHEGIHALGRLDVMQDYFRPIQEYINRKFTPEDLDKFYADYMSLFEMEDEMRLRKYDEQLADNYQTGTPESDPRYWQHARIKDEIMSDIWESFIADKDPLYLTRTDLKNDANKIAKPLGRLANMLATFMGKTGDPSLLSGKYRDRSGKSVDYGDPQLTAEINNLIKFQQRLKLDDDGKVIRGEVSESDTGNIIDTSEMTEATVPKNLIIAKHDENGNYQFDARGKLVMVKNQKELRNKERLRKNFLRTVFQDQDYRPEVGYGNKVPMNWDPETEIISGDYISEAAMQKIRNAPRWLFPPSLIETMERVNESIRRGEPMIIDYNARLVPKGKSGAQYSSKVGSSLRTSIPFGVYISKAGNLLYNTVDLGHLSEKYVRIMGDPKRRKAITNLWGQGADPQATRAAFDKDLVQYLNNIANPDPTEGVLKGLGDPVTARKKANVLSAFFGFKKKDINFQNNAQRQRILLEHLNPDRSDNLIRGRRLDAINDVSPAQLEKMPLNRDAYRRIQENFEPGQATDLDSLGLYSKAERVVQSMSQSKGTGEQFLSQLRKAGVKEEEINETGIAKFLQDNPKTTKEDLLEHIRGNQLELSEEVLGRARKLTPEEEARLDFLESENEKSPLGGINDTVGEDAFDELLTLQNIRDNSTYDSLYNLQLEAERKRDFNTSNHYTARMENLELSGGFEDKPKFSQYVSKGNEPGTYNERLILYPQSRGSFSTAHWDQSNVLGHVRHADRIGPDGERILFLEELQSDLHQKGRREGYNDERKNEAKAEYDSLMRQHPEDRRRYHEQRIMRLKEEIRILETDEMPSGLNTEEQKGWNKVLEVRKKRLQESVEKRAQAVRDMRRVEELLPIIEDMGAAPDLPYKKSWPELLMRRMLKFGADNGYDAIAWTDGETQNNRYDLSTQVDGVEVIDEGEGTYEIMAKPIGDDWKGIKTGVTKSELPDVIGKELAERALNEMEDGLAHFEGVDLKIGGEGMKGFYDKTLPKLKLWKQAKDDAGNPLKPTMKDLGDGINAHYVAIPDSLATRISAEGMARYEPGIKKDTPLIDTSMPKQKKMHKPGSATKTRAGFKVDQILFAEVWKGREQEDGTLVYKTKKDRKGNDIPDLDVGRFSSQRGIDILISKQPKGMPGTQKISNPDEFYERLDSANAWLASDIERFIDTNGYVEYMSRAGAFGDILVPPSGLATLLNNPKHYVGLVKGGYHGSRSLPNTVKSAHEGLDATVEMRKSIGDQPTPWVTALHHLWGVLSKQLAPVLQESGWLRLVSNKPVLDAIQSSIDGELDISQKHWSDLVSAAYGETSNSVGGIGNGSTSNANSFYLMLKRLNGKWDQMSAAYNSKNTSKEMGREFWKLVNENGPMSIKNKVQRFIGLTFGTPGVIMDRWKFVEFNLPMLMNRIQSDGFPATSTQDYFTYGLGGKTPEDPSGIYGVYGTIENKSPSFSTAFYEGVEELMKQAIANSSDLRELLGKHQNAGGLHWVGWNAIKNEEVGHSSLNLTKDITDLVAPESINPDTILKIINSGEYFTEGANGSKTYRVSIKNGEFSYERVK